MSSFKRRVPSSTSQSPAAQQALPKQSGVPSGTRVSAYNGALLISTGVASLDDILGGGLPLGSVLLIEEDKDTSYAKLLLKYWIAQGLACQDQHVLVASHSLDQPPEEIVPRLPFAEDDGQKPAKEVKASRASLSSGMTDDEDDDLAASTQESMKIAFRYEGLKKFETSVRASTAGTGDQVYCSMFDITKTMASSSTRDSRLHTINIDDEPSSADAYASLLEKVTQRVQDLCSGSNTQTPAVRIAIQSIATPTWGNLDMPAAFRFLSALRLLVQRFSLNAAAVVTLPGYLIRTLKGGSALLRRLEWACDSVIELETFSSSPSLQAVFPAYSGFLHVHRLPTPFSLLPPAAKLSVLRGLAPGSSSTSSGAGGMDNNLGFKLKRRRGLVIETLHLDEGGGTSERRTTPAPTVASQTLQQHEPKGSPANDATEQQQATIEISARQDRQEDASQTKVTKVKPPRRRIRFDDDPNENLSGILGSSTTPQSEAAKKLPSATTFQRDRPELYEF